MEKHLSALIVGIGNALLGDEGVGIVVLERLKSLDLPEEVALIQCDTDFLSIESSFAGQRHIVVIDAIRTGDKPGTIHCIQEFEFGRFDRKEQSAHHLSAIQSAMLLKRLRPQFRDSEFIFFGIEPRDIVLSRGLSPPVEAAVGPLIKRVRQFLHV